MADVAVAVDIGATKIVTGLVDSDAGVWNRVLVRTPSGDADELWAAVHGALSDSLRSAAGRVPVGIGVSCAGPVDPATGTVSPFNLPAWRGFPLVAKVRDLVAELTGQRGAELPISCATDGMCMTLGEGWVGAGRHADSLLGLQVSTGVSGGVLLERHPFHGRTGNAGNVGHIVVEPDGAPCPCGGRGCLETVAGAPGLIQWARVKGWQAPPDARPEHLAAAALGGDKLARTAFERAGYAIGLAAVAVSATCDLDLVVVGGGLASVEALLFDPLRRAVNTHAKLPHQDTLRVVPSVLSNNGALIGAGALVHQPG